MNKVITIGANHTEEIVGEIIPYGEPVYNQVMHFLIQEAKSLDELRMKDWLELLDEDIFYHMPIRRTVIRGGEPQFHPTANWFHESKQSIAFKVRRIEESGSGWADDPATRVRRLVTNLSLYETGPEGLYLAENYLLATRSRGDECSPDIISAKRVDVLRATSTGFKIIKRSIYIDQTVLGVPSLAFFL